MRTKFWILLTVFVLGIGLGISVPTWAPKYFESYLPKAKQGSKNMVEGTVVKKQNDPDRLLLTISSSEGAVLATFKKKVTEISLLIEEGDTVTLNVQTYQPFVDDPPVMRVRKPEYSISQQDVMTPLESAPRLESEGSESSVLPSETE